MEYASRSLTSNNGNNSHGTTPVDEFWINTPPSLDTPNKNGTQSPTPETVAYQALRIPSKGLFSETEIPLEPFNALSPSSHARPPYPIPEFGVIIPQPMTMNYSMGMSSNEPLYMPTTTSSEETQEQFSYPKIDTVPAEIIDVPMTGVNEYPGLVPLEIPTNFEVPPQTYSTWNPVSVLEIPQMEFESSSGNHTPSAGYVSDSSTNTTETIRVSTRVRRVCRSCAKDHKQCVGNPCSRCQQRGKNAFLTYPKYQDLSPRIHLLKCICRMIQ